MDEIALQEQQGLLKRRLEDVLRGGFHSAMASRQDLALVGALVDGLSVAVAARPDAVAAVEERLGRVPAVAAVRARVEEVRARVPDQVAAKLEKASERAEQARAAGAAAAAKAARLREAAAKAQAMIEASKAKKAEGG